MGLFKDLSFANILGAVTQPINSIIEGQQSRKNINLENQLNLQQADLAYKRQLDMFNLANQYNSPSAQMDRYKKAGLNPNLIYGQGSSGNAPNVLPQYRAPAMQANYKPLLSLNNTVQDLRNMMMQSEQLKILKAERRKADASATITEAEAQYARDNAMYRSNNLYNLLGPSALKRFMSLNELRAWADQGDTERGITSYKMKEDLTPFFADWIFNRYSKPGKELENYNSMIALRNAQKDYQDLEITNYLPPWVRALPGAIGSIGGAISRFIPKKIPTGEFTRGFNNKGNYATLKTYRYK